MLEETLGKLRSEKEAYIFPHTTIYVETYIVTLSIYVTGIRKGGLYMCPHTTIYLEIYTMKSLHTIFAEIYTIKSLYSICDREFGVIPPEAYPGYDPLTAPPLAAVP